MGNLIKKIKKGISKIFSTLGKLSPITFEIEKKVIEYY